MHFRKFQKILHWHQISNKLETVLPATIVLSSHPGSKELDELNLKIADCAVRGQLDSSPFLHGILLQMMRKLDKERRGVSMVGRPLSSNATEHILIQDAAFEFALMGRHKELAVRLGQSLRPPTLSTEELPSHSLPNPCLALASFRSDILRENLQAINKLFSLAANQQERRLMVAIDHTYLSKQLVQAKLNDQAGLIGPAWSPHDEGRCWQPFSSMADDAAKQPGASLMLECLCWNPCESSKNRTFSICSMPMALKACTKDPDFSVKDSNRGKWVTWLNVVRICLQDCNFLRNAMKQQFHLEINVQICPTCYRNFLWLLLLENQIRDLKWFKHV